MGFALADECASRGARVLLVTGPVQRTTRYSMAERRDVESAAQMYEAATSLFPQADAAILCAAVADYTPEHVADEKIKREKTGDMTLIAAALGRMKADSTERKVLVGFALETHNEQQNAEDKLKRKNLDFIVLNSLNDKGAGFRYDTNKVTLIDAEGRREYPLKTKDEVAADIVDRLAEVLNQ